MEIPIEAQVNCSDGSAGKSTCVLINPVTEQVTHLVIREDVTPEMEYMVPVELILLTTSTSIQLRCSKTDLQAMEPFLKTEFVEEKLPAVYASYGEPYEIGTHYLWPYVSPEQTVKVAVEQPQIPPGELVVHHGAKVEATDGSIGKIDEFLINPENGHITHLVMREGHLWGQKDVTIPLSAIGEAQKEKVILKIDKKQVESLPSVRIHRHWA